MAGKSSSKTILPDLLVLGYRQLKIIGFHPNHINFTASTILRLLVTTSLSVLIFHVILQQIAVCTSLGDTAFNIIFLCAVIQVCASLSSLFSIKSSFQVMSKITGIVLNANDFKFVANQQNIWNIEDVCDVLLRKQISQHFSIAHKTQQVLWWMMLTTACSRYAHMAFGYNVLPLTNLCIIIEQNWWYWFLVATETVFIVVCIFVTPTLDILFVGACTVVSTQFKMANHAIRTMDHTSSSSQRQFVKKYAKLQK